MTSARLAASRDSMTCARSIRLVTNSRCSVRRRARSSGDSPVRRRQQPEVVLQVDRGGEQLARDRLGTVQASLEQHLLADAVALVEQRRPVDGHGRIGGRQPVGHHELGVEEGAQHPVGHQHTRPAERGVLGVGRAARRARSARSSSRSSASKVSRSGKKNSNFSRSRIRLASLQPVSRGSSVLLLRRPQQRRARGSRG